MRTLLIAVAAVVVIGGGAFTGLWYFASSEVENFVDAEVERLRAEGAEISWSERIVEGFPTALSVEFRDLSFTSADGRVTFTAPWTRTEAAAADVGLVRTTFAPEMTLRLDTETPNVGVLDFAIEQTDLTITSSLQSATEAVEVTAAALSLAQTGTEATGGDEATAVAAVFSDLSLDMTEFTIEVARPEDRADRVVGTMTAATWAAGYGSNMAPGMSGDVDFSFNDLEIELDTPLGMTWSLSEMITGAHEVENEIRASGLNMTMEMGDPDLQVLVDASSGPVETTSTWGNGRISSDGGYTDLTYTVTQSGAPIQLPPMSVSFGGLRAAGDMPMTKTPEVAPMDFRLEIEDLVLAEEVWALFDPGEALPRDPANLELDVSGLMRWLFDPLSIQPEPVVTAPVEVTRLEDSRLALSLLGAEAEAEGTLDIDWSGPAPVADGQVAVRLVRVIEMLDTLAAARLLPPQQVQLPRAMLLGFTRQGESPEERLVDLQFKNGQVTANGQPLQ
ncbi:MAG: DUF2125 domain-containing protein [Pseudomonadota bacterium]